MLFQPGGEAQVLAQFGGVFVYGEAGANGGQFDDVAIGVAGVDALKVDAIHDGGNGNAGALNPLAPD